MGIWIPRYTGLARPPDLTETFRVNARNPLATGLRMVWWPGCRVNPVDGRPYIYTTAQEISIQRAYGKWPATRAQVAGSSRAVDLGPAPNNSLSFILLGDKASSNNQFFFSTRTGNTAGFELLTTNTTQVSLRISGNANNYFPTGLNNQVHLFGASLYGTTYTWYRTETYLDGAENNVNPVNLMNAGHSQNLKLFLRGTTYAGSGMNIRFFALREQQWTPGEHKALCDNPYQLLI